MSIVEGGYPGDNSGVDPKIVDAEGHLAPDSPAIDAGNSALVPTDMIDLDLDGNVSDEFVPLDLGIRRRFRTYPSANPALPGVDPFRVGGVIDLGAHEFQGVLASKP